MTRDEVSLRLQADEILVVDVRHPFEFRAGHITGAVNIPFWQGNRLVELAESEDRELVLTCEHGPRAWLAAGLIRVRAGRAVELLQGHMTGWKRAGLPLTKQS
ncbi:MAG: rhodanese-like domain-containing protein [Geothermobacteraceae bacterium]